jgi:ankyrin repeat protein
MSALGLSLFHYPHTLCQSNHDGNLPLHILCQHRGIDFDDRILMISSLWNVDSTNSSGSNNSFRISIGSSRMSSSRMIPSYCRPNRCGRTPFHEACYHHHGQIVDHLLQCVDHDDDDHSS